VYAEGSSINPKNMKQLKQWLEAFFLPCPVEILPNIEDQVLCENKEIARKENECGFLQYNAIHILKYIIGPIQKAKSDAIGVISFTDIDLYTKDLSNYCFGYGIPALGGI
jgi:predicted Zn-dependent protease